MSAPDEDCPHHVPGLPCITLEFFHTDPIDNDVPCFEGRVTQAGETIRSYTPIRVADGRLLATMTLNGGLAGVMIVYEQHHDIPPAESARLIHFMEWLLTISSEPEAPQS